MPQKYVLLNADGTAQSFMSDEINEIPEEAIKITDEQWSDWIANTYTRRWVDGEMQSFVPEPAPEPVNYGRTYKTDIWRRCTDDEAATLDAALTEAPVKLRRLWDDSQVLMHEAPEFETMREPMVTAFGAQRADELLAPSFYGA